MRSILSLGFLVRFVVTSVVLGIVAALVAFIVLWSGAVNFAASQNLPNWFESMVHWSFKNSVYSRGDDIEVPSHVDLSDPGLIALGANHYAQTCTRCHGGPDLGQNAQAFVMDPRPQYLPAVLDEFEPGDLHWILEHGVMMSAMPAWPSDKRGDDEPWAVVAFLEALKQGMTTEQYLDIVRPQTGDIPLAPFEAPDQRISAELPGAGETPWPEQYSTSVPTGGFADYALAGVPVAQCTTCHGADGSGAPTNGHAANLSILDADYISTQLRAYASGKRNSGFMQVVASQLTPDQMDALGAYFGRMPDTTLDVQAEAEVIARGKDIATLGVPDAGAPACGSCHVSGDATAGEWHVPPLAGQAQTYLETQLRVFRAGLRGSAMEWTPMHMVAHDLDSDDIAAVAAFYASLQPGEEPGLAGGDTAAAVQTVSAVCSECHQDDMAGVPSGEYPNLTLQTDGYILTQLHAFRTDGRQAERMQQTAHRLDAQEIAALAQFVGSLPAVARDGEPVEGDAALGRQIADNGLPDRDVPPCMMCHASEVTAKIAAIPRLQGQYPKYLLHRLEAFEAERGRLAGGEDVYSEPMHRYAEDMTDEEMAALAAYFAAEPAVSKTD